MFTLEAGTSFTENIYFDFNKSYVKAEEAVKVGRIAQILKDNPNAGITITGHADSATGSKGVNQAFARRRAAAVAALLEKAGVAASRITVEAAGDKDASAGGKANRVAVCIVK